MLSLYGIHIIESRMFKYIGHIINNTLTDHDDINSKILELKRNAIIS